MRLCVIHCAGAALIAVAAAGDCVRAQDDAIYQLVFEPPKDKVLVVQYSEDNTWEYVDLDMAGTLRTELELRWRFDLDQRPEHQEPSDQYRATGQFHSVIYRGKGHKKGEDFDHDVAWTRQGGYTKGAGSKAVKTWVAEEVEEGVSFKVGVRAAADPGEC